MKLSSTFAAVALVLLAATSVGCAPSVYSKDSGIKELLKSSKDIARGRGFRKTLAQGSGQLNNRQMSITPVDLKAGRSYLIVGLCEAACSDLDLEVFDGEGFVLAGDTLDDEIPLFELNPDQDGRFPIGARMIVCDREPCAFAFGVYGK